MKGPADAARLRGTDVTAAEAARSSGGTIAMTYELRVGTSICDKAPRMSRRAITQPRFGANGMAMRHRLDGRCVNTMVFTSPIFFAIRTATKYENAENKPVPKKMVPARVGDKWNF